MKTLLISSDYPPMVSGIANACYNFWKYLPSEKVVVLAPKVEGYEKYDKEAELKTYRYSPAFTGTSIISRVCRFMMLLKKILKIVNKEDIKLLHAGQPVLVGFVARLFAGLFDIPYVIYVYGGEVKKFEGSIFFKLFVKNMKESRAVIVNSNYTASEIRHLIPEKEIKTVYPGVDTKKFVPQINTEELEEKYNVKKKTVLLTVARLVKRKGQHLVLEAIDRLKKEYPDLVYLIVGEGPRRETLEELAEAYGLKDRVIFAGEVDEEELPVLYNVCDIFIMLSTLTDNEEVVEGFGISFMEANSCGKPVIGGKTGGVVEAVKDGETGFLVVPEDINQVVAKTRRFLENKSLRKKFGKKGRQRAQKEFDWRKLSRQFLDYIV